MARPTTTKQTATRFAPSLRRCWYQINQIFRLRIHRYGCTPDQFTVLRWLIEHPEDISQRRLAELMASDQNTIASLVSRMESAKMVIRNDHARDGRCNILIASSKGQALFKRINPIAEALQTQLLKAIPRDEREGFLANLCRLADAGREPILILRAARRANSKR